MSDDPAIQPKLPTTTQYNISESENLDSIEKKESEWRGHDCEQLNSLDDVKVSSIANPKLQLMKDSTIEIVDDEPTFQAMKKKHEVKAYIPEKTDGEKAIEDLSKVQTSDSLLGKALEKIANFVLSKLS